MEGDDVLSPNQVTIMQQIGMRLQQMQGADPSRQRGIIPMLVGAAVAVDVVGGFAQILSGRDKALLDRSSRVPLHLLKTFSKELMLSNKIAKARMLGHGFPGAL